MDCPSSRRQEISGGGRPCALQRRLTELPSLMSTSELVSSSLKLGGTVKVVSLKVNVKQANRTKSALTVDFEVANSLSHRDTVDLTLVGASIFISNVMYRQVEGGVAV